MVDMLKNQENINKKLNELQFEVLRIGKSGILKKYHPDVNMEEKSFKWFALYNDLIKNMENRIQEFEYEFSEIENFSEIQSEILKNGWVGVVNKYHPDFNIECENVHEVFNSYREVYDAMKERLLIA
jgi:UDP-N-acetylglucosamine 2-epimerase